MASTGETIGIGVKLFADLKSYAPDGKKAGSPFPVELAAGSTLADLITLLGIPPSLARVTFVNGRSRRETFSLSQGDEVGIFPPVGGG